MSINKEIKKIHKILDKQIKENKFVKQGWECPICGAVMNPDQRSCINCKGLDQPFYSDWPDQPRGNYPVVVIDGTGLLQGIFYDRWV